VIIRKKLTPNEISSPRFRYNPETDVVEETWDFGATWVENPAADPRTNPADRAPALSGGTAQCDAAAGMVAQVRKQIDAALTVATVGAVATTALEVALLFLPGIGLLIDLIIGFADLFVAAGSAAVVLAFTEEAYDNLLCIFYENIDVDGQADDAAISAIRDQINSELAGLVATLVNSMLDAWGANGLSNAGSLAGETGDCEDCVTDCVSFLNGDGLGDLVPVFGTTYDSGTDKLVGFNFGATNYCSLTYTGTEAMVSFRVTVSRSDQSANLGTYDLYAMHDDDFGSLVPLDNFGGLGSGTGEHLSTFTMPSGYNQLYFSPGATGSGSQLCEILAVEICSAS